MRTTFYLLFLLVNIGPVNAYSCLPPELGVGGCNPKYFTMPQMEDAIHGLKGLTTEGKSFIYSELLKKRKMTYFTLNLKIFSEELCQKSRSQDIDLFNNGHCPAELLSYSLYPGSNIPKLDGSIEVDVKIGPGGKFESATFGGSLNF